MHKRITFLIGPAVSEHFYKAKDSEMSQQEVYEFNVPTFGKGVVFDVVGPGDGGYYSPATSFAIGCDLM